MTSLNNMENDFLLGGESGLSHTMVVQDLGVHLNGNWILKNLSFELNAGEFFAVIGPNGAGKSTLLKTVLGLQSHQSGSISYAKEKSLIGYVPQSRQMDPDSPLKVWDFVSFGLVNRYRPWLTRDDKKRIYDALDITDCMAFSHRPIGKLSGGQRQRAYLAQALVRAPEVLFLDEPTSNLDPGSQTKVVDVVANICNVRGVSVVFVTHDMNLVSKYADRVLYITHGRHALGSVDEIMNCSVLSMLYGTPIQLVRVGRDIVIVPLGADHVPI